MKRLWPILGYLVIIVLVFGRAFIPPEGQMIFGDDIHLTYYFFRKFFAQFFWQGTIPWWNPYAFAGQPMMAHPQALLMFYPLNWLFVILPTNIAVSVYLAIHMLLAMMGMYWFMRRFVHPLPAWTGGIIFGLSGFFMARIWAGHMDMIAAAAWVPWVFGAFWSVLADRRVTPMIMAGVLLALQVLAGYQTMALFTLEAVGVALLFQCIHTRSFYPALRVGASIAIALGLAAVQLIPEGEFASRSIRTFALGYDWTSGFSLLPSQLSTAIFPFFFGDQRSYTGQWPNYAEYAFFIGVVPLTLVAICLLLLFSKRIKGIAVWSMAAITLISVWVAFGPNAPFDLLKILWKLVPLYSAIRIPSRHLILFVFGTSFLAAYALATMRNRRVQGIVTIAIVIELVLFARHFIELRPVPETRHDKELVALLSPPPRCRTPFTWEVNENDCELFRILPNFGVWLPERANLDFESSLTYRIFSATGYDPSILRNYYEFVDNAGGHETSSILEHNVQVPYLPIPSDGAKFLNIKYVLTPENGNLKLSTMGDRDVLPRFFVVREAIVLDDVRGAIRNQTYDLSKVALFDRQVPSVQRCQSKEDSSVIVDSYTPNKIELTVSSPCDGFLASSEVLYPGWDAKIDGVKTDIFESNMAFRAVYVPRGNHTVVYRFFPYSFVVGGLISLVTILGCFVLARKRHTTHE